MSVPTASYTPSSSTSFSSEALNYFNASPRTPATPIDQLIHRPSAPPAMPRHSQRDDDDDAHSRRVKRLFAPTPTEWSFSSTLNHVPTPSDESFDRDSFGAVASPIVADEIMQGDDTITVESEAVHEYNGDVTTDSITFTRRPQLGFLATTFLNTANSDAFQPLASPYAAHFPSPSASVISLPTSVSSSSSSSSFAASSFASSGSSSSLSSSRAASPLTSSPVQPQAPNPILNYPLRRPAVPHRRSSLGPGRALSLSTIVSAAAATTNLKQNMTMMTSSPSAMGYFDVRPSRISAAAAAAAAITGVEEVTRSRSWSWTDGRANMLRGGVEEEEGEKEGGSGDGNGSDNCTSGTVTPGTPIADV